MKTTSNLQHGLYDRRIIIINSTVSSFTKMKYYIVCAGCMVVFAKDNTISTIPSIEFGEIIGIFDNRATKVTSVPSKRPTGIFRREKWVDTDHPCRKRIHIVLVEHGKNAFGFVTQIAYLVEEGIEKNCQSFITR